MSEHDARALDPDLPLKARRRVVAKLMGVPDRDFDLKGAGKLVYQRARKNAQDAFGDLDAEFE